MSNNFKQRIHYHKSHITRSTESDVKLKLQKKHYLKKRLLTQKQISITEYCLKYTYLIHCAIYKTQITRFCINSASLHLNEFKINEYLLTIDLLHHEICFVNNILKKTYYLEVSFKNNVYLYKVFLLVTIITTITLELRVLVRLLG